MGIEIREAAEYLYHYSNNWYCIIYAPNQSPKNICATNLDYYQK
jgi:hypothetical protein